MRTMLAVILIILMSSFLKFHDAEIQILGQEELGKYVSQFDQNFKRNVYADQIQFVLRDKIHVKCFGTAGMS